MNVPMKPNDAQPHSGGKEATMDKNQMEEMLAKMKAAKSPEAALAIAKAELNLEDAALVAGGNGRVELTENQTERVVGGGHYVSVAGCTEDIWIQLVDGDYVCGTDPYYDAAYALETMAMNGATIGMMIDMSYSLFPKKRNVPTSDIKNALVAGGPIYLADCWRDAHGYSW